jgi:hypothetical protein
MAPKAWTERGDDCLAPSPVRVGCHHRPSALKSSRICAPEG